MGERFTLEWAEYQKSVATAFENVRISQDFTDVTLVGEDYELEAHRLVLSSGSDFFQRVLSRTKHHHPFVYLKGIPQVNVESILSFLYCGEATVSREGLEQFILTAKELGIRGVLDYMDKGDENEENNISTKQKAVDKPLNCDEIFAEGDGDSRASLPEVQGRKGTDSSLDNEQIAQKRSSAWSYFDRVTETFSFCKMCGTEVQTKCSNTSGLWRHMASAHKDIDMKIAPIRDQPIDVNFKETEDVSLSFLPSGAKDVKKDTDYQPEGVVIAGSKRLPTRRSRIWEQFKRLPDDLAACNTCNRLIFFI